MVLRGGKTHGTIRCYPCIRGCAFVKIVLGSVLLMLGCYMLAVTPIVLDCSGTRASCPQLFGSMLDDFTGVPNGHIEKEAAVNDYCDCMISCMNYMAVYRLDGQKADPGNCFLKSQAAGIAGIAASGQKPGNDNFTVLPGMSTDECYSCADTSNAQDGLFMSLVTLATLCGIVLFVTAGCEHMEVKHHNISFTVCGICSDIVCGLALFLAWCLSLEGTHLADSACRPVSFNAWFTQAGKDSTMHNPDQAALFAQFFMSTFKEAFANLCSEEKTFKIFCLITALGILSSVWSFAAALCVVLGFSDDSEESEDDDHKRAGEHKDLLKSFQGHRVTS